MCYYNVGISKDMLKIFNFISTSTSISYLSSLTFKHQDPLFKKINVTSIFNCKID